MRNGISAIRTSILLTVLLLAFFTSGGCTKDDGIEDKVKDSQRLLYAIAPTNQSLFYDNSAQISIPGKVDAFYGQDACYCSNSLSYTKNGDGTVTDNITGLMWTQSPDLNNDGEINYDDKLSFSEALSEASNFKLAGYTDWRLPTIKELYSLIIFSGLDVDPMAGEGAKPFIATDYFQFAYGDMDAGERIIDAQFASSTLDVGDSHFAGGNLVFGVNFADGRIKGYPTGAMRGINTEKKFYVFYVRGNEKYGQNDFTDNGDGTITDKATGLMWMQDDSGNGMTWEEALKFAESKEFAGCSDWRLPNIKELQSIVDYERAPGATGSAAINPTFHCTHIQNEAGEPDFPYYWSGTTHASVRNGSSAAYISFGRAMGYFNGEWQDVHGAGAQRSDPKSGSADAYPYGHGPQGDAIRILNFVRLVRNAD